MECDHKVILVLPKRPDRLRCVRCHLTIDEDELGGDFCPECFEGTGSKNYDFETVASTESEVPRFRCDGCGMLVGSSASSSDGG